MGGWGGVVCIRWWWWWGCAFVKCETGEGVWVKNPKPSHVKQQWGMVGKGGGVVQLWCWLWCGHPIGSMRGGEEVWAKNHKTKHDGSVSGPPLEIAVGSDEGRW